jgi:hypothetical protein
MVQAGSAGSVTLRIVGNTLHVVSMQLNTGWTAGTPQESESQVQIQFKKGDHKIQLTAMLQGGQINVTAEEHSD